MLELVIYISGPSGSGKTTILNLLERFLIKSGIGVVKRKFLEDSRNYETISPVNTLIAPKSFQDVRRYVINVDRVPYPNIDKEN